MSDLSPSPAPTSELPAVAPTLQLSRRGLIYSLLAMVLGGLCVFFSFPEAIDGDSLPVEVELGVRPVETTGGQGAVMTDVLIISNQADHEIGRLGVKINGQYLLHRESPLGKREELVLPLRVFTDKRSSQRYNPRKYPPEEVLVTGQLPGGSRGLSQFFFGDQR